MSDDRVFLVKAYALYEVEIVLPFEDLEPLVAESEALVQDIPQEVVVRLAKEHPQPIINRTQFLAYTPHLEPRVVLGKKTVEETREEHHIGGEGNTIETEPSLRVCNDNGEPGDQSPT